MGLHHAGFDVTGVDIEPQPRYPFNFVQADALEFPLDGYDFIWASPPCQAYAQAALGPRNAGKSYQALIEPVRRRLESAGVPFAIENVMEAPLKNAFMLCGSMFGLRVWRHRLFETNFWRLTLMHPCNHVGLGICAVGRGTPSWIRSKNGGKNISTAEVRAAMGIDWMNRLELSQAIPPAYSEFIGRHALEFLARIEPELRTVRHCCIG